MWAAANLNERTNQKHQKSIKLCGLDWTFQKIVHIKNTQINKINIIQHIAYDFYGKYSDVTYFVIINSFKSNCNLITHSFSVTVTGYNYFYFVIK